MPRFLLCFAAFATLFAASPCVSATLELVADASHLQLPAGGSDETVIGVFNAGADDASLAAWQVSLQAVPDPGAVGSIEVSAFTTPNNYFFASLPSFGISLAFGTELPSSSPIFSDALTTPRGASIVNGHWANLVAITISASANAKGIFRLNLPALTGDFSDSFWIDETTFLPTPFENNADSSPNRTLVTVEIQSVPEPGTGVSGLVYLVLFTGRSRRGLSRRPRIN